MKKLIIIIINLILLSGCNLIIGILGTEEDIFTDDEPVLRPSSEPTSGPSQEPSPDVTSDPTPFVTFEPTPESTPDTSYDPTPEPTLIPEDIYISQNGYIIPHSGTYYDIGNSLAGVEKTIDFIIENRGEEILYLYNEPRVILEANQFFLIEDADSSIGPAGTTDFIISFIPPAVGAYQASITIESSDGNKSPYQFYIIGTGLIIPEPEMTIRYGNTFISHNDVLDIGGFRTNNEKREVFHIRNIGTADLVLSGIPYVNIRGNVFSLIKDAVSPIPPGSGTTFQIGFTPDAETGYTGIVTIESNNPDLQEIEYTITGYGLP